MEDSAEEDLEEEEEAGGGSDEGRKYFRCYNYSMNIMSTAFVALMLIDLMQPALRSAVPSAQSQYFENGSGTLTVVTDSSHVIGSIPQGASRVPFLTVSMSASCESDIRVTSIDLKHVGLGSSQDIASVYAVEGFTRITRVAHFDVRRSDLTLRFRSLVLPKCGAVTFTVHGDMKSDAAVAAEHSIVLSGLQGIVSNAKQIDLSTGDPTRKVISPSGSAGSLTIRMLPTNARVRYGRIETVARVQLTAGPKTSQLLKRITFTNTETARDMDLQWLSLETLSGNPLTAPVPRMHGYRAIFDFSPSYILDAGQTLVLNLKAEARGSQTKKINFMIEETADVVATPHRER